jgi:hypothetical protein
MDEDKWISEKAKEEDGAMVNAGKLEPVVDAYSYNKLADINTELLETLKEAAEVLASHGKSYTVGLEMRIEQAIAKAEGSRSG